MTEFRRKAEAIRTDADIRAFFDEILSRDFNVISHYGEILSRKDLRKVYYSLTELRAKCVSSGFPNVKKREVERKKARFVPEKLGALEREGEDYRKGRHVTTEAFERTFGLRAGEFGNSLPEKERQEHLDQATDAFLDIADVLMIEPTDISFGGKLAVAWGSRGRGGSAAYYDPIHKCVSFNRMNGAGYCAKLYAYALLCNMAVHFNGGIDHGWLITEHPEIGGPDSFWKLIQAMQYSYVDGRKCYTDFYRGSRHMDRLFYKDSFGLWSSEAEMFARAFACYVKDTLGCRSDYLVGYADSYVFDVDDKSICAIPQGEEREILNQLFDQLFFDLREDGFYTYCTDHKVAFPRPVKATGPQSKAAAAPAAAESEAVTLAVSDSGQMYFVF